MTSALIVGGGFSQLDLLLLADLYNALGEYVRAIGVIRRGTRWLQGRAEQSYWDLSEDDREFDLEGWPPRVISAETGSVQPGRFELDANARHRLAVARIKMGEIEEGKVTAEQTYIHHILILYQLHANAVLSEDVLDYAVLFGEIADAYFEREMYADAKPIYELLGGDPAVRFIKFQSKTRSPSLT